MSAGSDREKMEGGPGVLGDMLEEDISTLVVWAVILKPDR